jgi:hypothetical protein
MHRNRRRERDPVAFDLQFDRCLLQSLDGCSYSPDRDPVEGT